MGSTIVEDQQPRRRAFADRGRDRHDRVGTMPRNAASSLLRRAWAGVTSAQRMLKPVEKQRVAEEIAEQLRSLILGGQYPPGSKLPPERELSKRLRVNRASLREALKKLEHLGLVRIRQGDGTRVQNFMETGGIELVQHLLPLAGGKPELIRDLLEFRRIFGRELARLAAARTPKQSAGLSKLRALADRADQVTGALELFDLDFDFYVAVAQRSEERRVGQVWR